MTANNPGGQSHVLKDFESLLFHCSRYAKGMISVGSKLTPNKGKLKKSDDSGGVGSVCFV